MKKIISILLLVIVILSNYLFVYSSSNVQVTAVVGNFNQAPLVTSIIPSVSPISVEYNTSQNITVKIKDTEWNSVFYTVSSPVWAVSILNWTLSNSQALKDWTAYINFTYLAPLSWVDQSFNLTITLNDWPNFVTRTIPMYVYNF